MNKNKDIKFIIYQSLYIFVVCVIAIKGANLDLVQVIADDGKPKVFLSPDSLQKLYEIIKKSGVKLAYAVGTMIELPRAALLADQIAEVAEFFSYGTNDLTQMTFGFSRDDAGKFLPTYFQMGILERDPFVSIDVKGVGELVRIATEKGRKTRPDLKLGTCGEHGGDPDSVRFFHRVGLDYVSCSPYDVPVARLAAARAAMEEAVQSGAEVEKVETADKAREAAK